jgi:hypothetical protein
VATDEPYHAFRRTQHVRRSDRIEASDWHDLAPARPTPVEQSHTHRALEAFLAAFVRVSLLV